MDPAKALLNHNSGFKGLASGTKRDCLLTFLRRGPSHEGVFRHHEMCDPESPNRALLGLTRTIGADPGAGLELGRRS